MQILGLLLAGRTTSEPRQPACPSLNLARCGTGGPMLSDFMSMHLNWIFGLYTEAKLA